MAYYVTMTDSFMSDWGRAKGLTNKLVFICETLDDAEYLIQKASSRDEMKYICLCLKKPKYFLLRNYNKGILDYVYEGKYVQIKTKEDYPNWYPAKSASVEA